jgi:hypothetical protein
MFLYQCLDLGDTRTTVGPRFKPGSHRFSRLTAILGNDIDQLVLAHAVAGADRLSIVFLFKGFSEKKVTAVGFLDGASGKERSQPLPSDLYRLSIDEATPFKTTRLQ